MAARLSTSPKWYGECAAITLLMEGQHDYSFVIEEVGDDQLEMTICTYFSENTKQNPKLYRKEWVMQLSRKKLTELNKGITRFLGEAA